MNYSNNVSRLQIQDPAVVQPPQKLLSLEPGKRGLCLRVRAAATMARLRFEPYRLPVVAAVAVVAFLAPVHEARAQLGYDPFAANLSHAEEKWATYADATTGGANRPTSTSVNGVDAMLANAASFNFDVTFPTPSNAFVTGGGNIYSFSNPLTLTLTSTYAPTVGSFNTVVLSIKTLGNPVNTAGVFLTPSGGQAIAPRFVSISSMGSGMGASAQYAFQFDLSAIGGANNFSIALPGADSSVSFGSSQLDETTSIYGAQSVVPEPSSLAFLAALGGMSFVAFRRRGLV